MGIEAEHKVVSVQGSFLCAEAHPDLGGLLLVLAISESLFTWDDYCKELPATVNAATENYRVHPAVHAATQKVHMHTYIHNKGFDPVLNCHAACQLRTSRFAVTRHSVVFSAPGAGDIFAQCSPLKTCYCFHMYLQLHVHHSTTE